MLTLADTLLATNLLNPAFKSHANEAGCALSEIKKLRSYSPLFGNCDLLTEGISTAKPAPDAELHSQLGWLSSLRLKKILTATAANSEQVRTT